MKTILERWQEQERRRNEQKPNMWVEEETESGESEDDEVDFLRPLEPVKQED